MSAYEPSHVSRTRRTKAELAALDQAIIAAVEADSPVSLRGVYYRVVSAGAVDKTDAGYQAIGRRLKVLRARHQVSYRDIVDGTRATYRVEAYASAEAAIARTARLYQQELWSSQTDALMFVSEKDAISGVVASVTQRYQVPFLIVRGYSSMTAVYEFAEDIADRMAAGKNVFVYQLGDHDASGVDAWEAFQRSVIELLEHEFDQPRLMVRARVTFERLAVTEKQIAEMKLPTRRQKPSDTRARTWGDKPNVEVDAIPATVLRELVENTIASHIDSRQLEITKTAEKAERRLLLGLAGAA